MGKGDWATINWFDFAISLIVSGGIGMIRVLQLVRKGRQVKWVDFILEPAIAVVAGMMVWGIATVTGMPEVFKTVMVSIAAWGGPKTIRRLEIKYLGGSRIGDSGPVPFDHKEVK